MSFLGAGWGCTGDAALQKGRRCGSLAPLTETGPHRLGAAWDGSVVEAQGGLGQSMHSLLSMGTVYPAWSMYPAHRELPGKPSPGNRRDLGPVGPVLTCSGSFPGRPGTWAGLGPSSCFLACLAVGEQRCVPLLWRVAASRAWGVGRSWGCVVPSVCVAPVPTCAELSVAWLRSASQGVGNGLEQSPCADSM